MSAPVGPDGLRRCDWAYSAPEYIEYHDTEWGRPVHGDDAVYERMVLEAFQSGLSFITILRKRPAFRKAFAGFSIEAVAQFNEADVERLMSDAGIVRNGAKVNAAIANARAALALPEGVSELIWSFAPTGPRSKRPAPKVQADLPAATPESTAMAKELKGRGFRFIGPTTAYAHMQATGMVNDHLATCHARKLMG
jgi:DNA-3-methyladenine glycosylase I